MSVGYAIVDRWDERERASDEAADDVGVAIPFPHLLLFAPCDQKNK